REHEPVDGREPGAVRDEARVEAEPLERVHPARRVAGAVVDDADHGEPGDPGRGTAVESTEPGRPGSDDWLDRRGPVRTSSTRRCGRRRRGGGAGTGTGSPSRSNGRCSAAR